MKRILTSLWLLFLPLAALADGMVVPTIAYPAKVTIPDQRALICFSNGIERLVIETRFTGSGTNFAWVVPLPSRPVIEEATTGLFPTLEYLFRPQLVIDVPQYYPWIIALAWLVYALFFVRPTGRVNLLDIGSCLLVGIGIATIKNLPEAEWNICAVLGLLVFSSLILILSFVRLRNCLPRALGGAMLALFLFLQLFFVGVKGITEPSVPLLIIGFFLLLLEVVFFVYLIRYWQRASRLICTALLSCLLAILIIPLSYAFLLSVRPLSMDMSDMKSLEGSSSIAPRPAVSVLERKIVGIFETTTIASPDPKALQTWLSENGYSIPANVEPAIATYVKDGWVFVATKVRRDRPENETSTPHPLSFTFKTDKPVYPMRLTGLNGQPLSVELYVFGPARAQAAHFAVERCTRPNYPSLPSAYYKRYWYLRLQGVPVTLDIVHPLLRQWVNGSPVVTKLVGTLSAADMRKDVWLDWMPFREKQSRLFSRAGALIFASNRGSGFFAAALLAIGIFWSVWKANKRWLGPLVAAAAFGGIACTGAVYLHLPKTEVKWISGRLISTGEMIHWRKTTFQTAKNRNIALPPIARGENYFLGGLVREEDSPGNYLLRETNNELQFVIFDAEGGEHIVSRRDLPVPH